ncbi:enoyl-CoA hydratase/isomerase family protein [Rhodobacterales bacterium HKCCE2091]|nr:enoyl-CoA hydratase/isomerase family protein [Rhodobacterales bacterium HKCCE2091]
MTTINVDGPDARGLVRVTLARPEARNALNLEMCRELRAAFDGFGRDGDATRAVVIAAEGPVFSAGADLKERQGKSAEWVTARRQAAFDAYAAIGACPVPTIAVVDGPVIGSGGEIAMACDFILGTPRASFRWPEIGWGSVGATQRLPRRIGVARAKELLFTGRKLEAAEAISLGLITRMSDDLDALLAETLDRVLAAPVTAMRLAKHCVDRGMDTDLPGGVEIEMDAIRRSLEGDEWQEGLSAFARSGTGGKA